MSEIQEPDTCALEAKLAASEERFRRLVDISLHGVLVVNNIGDIQVVNDRAVNILNSTRERLLGKQFGYKLKPDTTSHIDIQTSEESTTSMQMQVAPICWDNAAAHLVLLNDTAAHKNSELVLKNAETELMQFTNVLMHDIKAPLRNIGAIASWFKEDFANDLDDTALNDLELLIDNANKMRDLVQGLMRFMQIGLQTITYTHVHLNAVFESVLANLNMDIKEREAQVSVESLPQIHANADLLEEMFTQLVFNSLRFCVGVPVITVSAQRQQEYWEIRIADNGIGVKAQDLEKIFEPLERLHSSSEYTGDGLGLSICKKIVAKHDGNISMESEIGAGSVVIVQLPVVRDF